MSGILPVIAQPNPPPTPERAAPTGQRRTDQLASPARSRRRWRLPKLNRLALVPLVTLIFLATLVADWILWPGHNVDILYAIPVFIVALYAPPRDVALVAAIALAVDSTGAWIARDTVGNWAVTIPGLAVICLFGVVFAQQRLEVSRRATEAEKTRSDLQRFLGTVAHEIASPLTALESYTEILQADQLPNEVRERVCLGMLQVMERMRRFVDDLRDAARLGSGSFVVRKEPTDLVAVARAVVEQQQVAAHAATIVLDTPEHLEGCWDPQRLSQVLGNLISNAVKYSDGAEVRVRLRAVGNQVTGQVIDRGPGISPENQDRIFDAFVRLDTGHPGTGLGLYIARAIVVAHGGRLWFESQPGGGATFCFTIPNGTPYALAAASSAR
jgi:signal transduction histidine kinase